MKKSLKIVLIVLAAIIAVVVIVSLLAAPVAKNYINKHGKELVGRNLHVDELRVNIYSGHVAIHNLSLYEDDDTTTFVAFDTLDVSAKLLRLLSHELYLKHITLSGLDVTVLQDGATFNFTSLLEHFATDEPKVEDTTASVWKVSVYNLRLSHGKVYYADQQRHCDWNLKDLNLKVPGFCIGGEEVSDAGLTIAFADGGTITADVHYDVISNDFNAIVDLDRFALGNLKAYTADIVRIGSVEGYLDAHLKAKGNVSHIMATGVSGSVSLRDVDLKATNKSQVASLRSLSVVVDTIDLGNNNFDIASVKIDGLKGSFDRYVDGNNFSRLMISQPTEETANTVNPNDEQPTNAQPMRLVVRRFDFTDGALTYSDHTLVDAFRFPVTKIAVHAENLTLQGNNGANIQASLPHGGTAMVKWRGSLDDISRSQDLELTIKNLHLEDLSPYTVAYLGHPFEEGVFSFVSKNSIRNSQLEGNNHLDIYKAVVGKKRKDVDAQVKIPLKAALYVLKDKDEKIQIDMPISGNLDNPEFNYMKVVWKTLGNFLIKVAEEPFKLAGNALGIGGNDETFIPVDPDQEDITSAQYYEFDKYANAALQTPELMMTFEMLLNTNADSVHVQLADFRNSLVLWHLVEDLKVPESQIEIKTTLVESLKRPGYRVIGTIKEETE